MSILEEFFWAWVSAKPFCASYFTLLLRPWGRVSAKPFCTSSLTLLLWLWGRGSARSRFVQAPSLSFCGPGGELARSRFVQAPSGSLSCESPSLASRFYSPRLRSHSLIEQPHSGANISHLKSEPNSCRSVGISRVGRSPFRHLANYTHRLGLKIWVDASLD